MKKKLFFGGIVTFVLAIGFMVIGCEEVTDGKVTVGNNSNDYTITKIKLWGEGGTDINEPVSLTKGQSKSWTLPIGDYKLTVNVDYHGEHSDLPLTADEISEHRVTLLNGNPEKMRFLYETRKESESGIGSPKGRTLRFGSKDQYDIVY